jgi:hypothetical protein
MFTQSPVSAYKAGLVRFYKGDKVIGAGLHVQNGYVITCAHVVAESLGLGKKWQGVTVESVADQPVKLDFPFVVAGKGQYAKIEPALWKSNDEDLAILKLLEAIPEGVTPSPLTESKDYRNHTYRVYGFPDGHPDGVWSEGRFVEEVTNERVQLEGTQAQGIAIEPGFSGAPVLDEELGTIVGITVARDQEREEAKVSFMIPYQKLKPALEAIALFNLLLPEADHLVPHWKAAYRFLRPEISTEHSAKTLQDAIVQVQDMTPRHSTYRAIDQFVGYLALPELGLLVQPKLLHWLQKQVKNRDDLDDLLVLVRQDVAVQKAKQPEILAPHLLFWVQEELNSDRFFAQAYLIPNREQYNPETQVGVKQLQDLAQLFEEGEKFSWTQLEEVLQICLNESVEKIEQEQEQEDFPLIRVEVFLSRRCLSLPIDQWSTDKKDINNLNPESIGSRYSVVLRSADRLNCSSQMKVLWKKKWNGVEKNQESPAVQWLICGDNQEPGILSRALSSDQVVGWHCLQPPQPVAERDPCSFSVMVGVGAPVAIWLRQSLPNSDQEISQLLNNRLSDLPASVALLRAEAHNRDDKSSPHIGENIGLIWDDPKLVPPGVVKPKRLRMSA